MDPHGNLLELDEATTAVATTAFIFRVVYSYLNIDDSRSQRRIVCLSHAIRNTIIKDINLLWKQRFEKVTKFSVDTRVDWGLACRLASESISSLYLLNDSRINTKLEALGILECADLQAAKLAGYHNTVGEMLRLWSFTQQEIDSLLVTTNLAILKVVIPKLRTIPSDIIDIALKDVKLLKVILNSEVPIVKSLYLDTMWKTVKYNRVECFSLLLANRRAVFDKYHTVLMLEIVTSKGREKFIKLLLEDPKGKGIPRNYFSSVKYLSRKLARTIALHHNVQLDEITTNAFISKFGSKYV